VNVAGRRRCRSPAKAASARRAGRWHAISGWNGSSVGHCRRCSTSTSCSRSPRNCEIFDGAPEGGVGCVVCRSEADPAGGVETGEERNARDHLRDAYVRRRSEVEPACALHRDVRRIGWGTMEEHDVRAIQTTAQCMEIQRGEWIATVGKRATQRYSVHTIQPVAGYVVQERVVRERREAAGFAGVHGEVHRTVCKEAGDRGDETQIVRRGNGGAVTQGQSAAEGSDAADAGNRVHRKTGAAHSREATSNDPVRGAVRQSSEGGKAGIGTSRTGEWCSARLCGKTSPFVAGENPRMDGNGSVPMLVRKNHAYCRVGDRTEKRRMDARAGSTVG